MTGRVRRTGAAAGGGVRQRAPPSGLALAGARMARADGPRARASLAPPPVAVSPWALGPSVVAAVDESGAAVVSVDRQISATTTSAARTPSAASSHVGIPVVEAAGAAYTSRRVAAGAGARSGGGLTGDALPGAGRAASIGASAAAAAARKEVRSSLHCRTSGSSAGSTAEATATARRYIASASAMRPVRS